MKQISIFLAVAGGAMAGTAIGLLFAPEKGCVTRQKIANCIKAKFNKIKPEKVDALIEEVISEISTNK